MDQIILMIAMTIAFILGAILGRGTPIVIGRKPQHEQPTPTAFQMRQEDPAPVVEPSPIDAVIIAEIEKEKEREREIARQMTNVMDYTVKVGKDKTHES